MRQATLCNHGGLFNIAKQGMMELRYSENPSKYVWGKPVTRMVLEVQCLAVALIVTSQVWILSYYGSNLFENLIGNDIALPLLYCIAVIMGTLTYVRPSYWRIASTLTAYSICIYCSLLVTTVELKVLMTPALAELLQRNPQDTGVWIPWAIGFTFHMHICITSCIIACISIRDMYYFEPVVANKGLSVEEIVLHPKQEPAAPPTANNVGPESTRVLIPVVARVPTSFI